MMIHDIISKPMDEYYIEGIRKAVAYIDNNLNKKNQSRRTFRCCRDIKIPFSQDIPRVYRKFNLRHNNQAQA